MHFPAAFHVLGKTISVHFILEIASIFIGVRYYMFLRKRTQDAISNTDRLKIFAAVCLGALVGSRLIGVLEDPPEFFAAQNKFQYIFSNKTIAGGLLFALFAVELLKLRLGIIVSSGDMMTYPLLLALIIGRLGCFFEGPADGTIGSETTLFTGVNFGDGIFRHPLPLYEIVFLIFTWIMIFILDKKQLLANGSKFKLFLISYFIYRFFSEFLKPESFALFGLNTIQLTCLAGLVYYFKTLSRPKLLFLPHA
jgi:phosphatidylglycerol---prolipoprotein diacylglyceryl transferase